LQNFDEFLFGGLVENIQVDVVVGGVGIVIDFFVITGEDVSTSRGIGPNVIALRGVKFSLKLRR